MNDDAPTIDLSVVVNAHSEGRLLRPTLRSVMAAIGELTATGSRCELLLVLDTATAATREEAVRWLEPERRGAVPVRVVEVSHADAGDSRNSGASNAVGRCVAFCDGDDLVSRNYFADALRALDESPGPLIVHPGTVLSFGARSALWHIPATEDVSHLELIRDNLWPSSSASQRSTYLDHPYRPSLPEEGFGPEDWLWNIETSIARIPHRPLPATMFFYRVRESGGVNNRHVRSILPAYDLDALIAAMPAHPPAAPQEPRTAREKAKRAARKGYLRVRPAVRVLVRLLPQRSKEDLYRVAMRVYRGRPLPEPPRAVPPEIVEHLRAAAELEPAVSWTAHGYASVPEWRPHDGTYSRLLVRLVKDLRAASGAIVAVPWVGIGGADLVSLNYARALAATPHFSGRVTMLATYTPSRTLRELVPPGVRFVQVSQEIRALTPDQQRRILAQALLMVGPELVVSVNCFDVTNSLQLYARQLGSLMRIYLTLFAFDRIGAGYPVNPITDDSQRAYLEEIDGIITDNTVTAAIISEMMALDSRIVRVHPQPALTEIPDYRTDTSAHEDSVFSPEAPFRVLWPHRLDKEKRPDSLVAIARVLREQSLPVRIEVYGQQVLSSDGQTLMASLAEAGVEYHGPYSGGLAALPTDQYHALLLTSESEGLPLVLVQSMLHGLPVIASAVGGVTDIVRDGETGLLAAGPEDAEGYVRAIRTLMESVEERRRIIRTAYDAAIAQHGWEHFTKLVDGL